jgi:hypothetical protein
MPEKLTKKIKSGKFALSPKSYNYLQLKWRNGGILEIPKTNARQDTLVDFLFGLFYDEMERVEDGDVLNHEAFSIVLRSPKIIKNPFGYLVFDTTKLRKETGDRKYSDKLIIEDLNFLRKESFRVKDVKIWADGDETKELTWSGSICGDHFELRTLRFGRQTALRIGVNIPMVIGLLWRNDALRKRFHLFLKDKKNKKSFFGLPKSAQKIFRYLSNWSYFSTSELTLKDFCDILNWTKEKHFPEIKGRIEKNLDVLRERGFISDWARLGNTKGWETRWKIFNIGRRGRLGR